MDGGVSSGAATDHWHRRDEDILLARGLGLNTYRFSVEWAKLEPAEGQWNEEAFAWYSALIDRCEEQGLVPMLTLHHFTLPQWLAQKGGFSVAESVGHFRALVEKVVARFGARVPLWCTFNEPMVLALGSYVGGFMPPAKHSPELLAKTCANLLESHALAYELIHAGAKTGSGPWRDWPVRVGIAHNMIDFLPDRWWHPIENALARGVRNFYNLAWLDAVTGRRQHFGVPFLLPYAPTIKRLLGKRTADFIGVNYYTKGYMRWRPRDSTAESLANMPVGISFARRLEEQSDLGWAVHPAGFRRMLEVAAGYGLPLCVTENGIADRDDRLRPAYLKTHLLEIARAISDGIDIRGYYHWSLLDNFEWVKGFGPRFGLFHVDYDTFARSPRPAAEVYQKIIAAHHGNQVPREDILLNLF